MAKAAQKTINFDQKMSVFDQKQQPRGAAAPRGRRRRRRLVVFDQNLTFVDQNLSILCQYQFRDVLCWANRIVKANAISKVYSNNYLKEQLYIRIRRLIKKKKRKSLIDMIELRKSARLYDKSISYRELFYIYRFISPNS